MPADAGGPWPRRPPVHLFSQRQRAEAAGADAGGRAATGAHPAAARRLLPPLTCAAARRLCSSLHCRTLTLRGELLGHKGWVTAIAAPLDPTSETLLSSSR